MSVTLLLTEVIVTFCIASCVLYRYGNWWKHRIFVTVSVLIAWYFSLLIIFILPLDVASTVFRQCEEKLKLNSSSLQPFESSLNISNISEIQSCIEPSFNVPDAVFPNLWRVVYWSCQFLTWIVLPLTQSYLKSGDFTIKGKFRTALVDNAIYYGSYLFICGILLIYMALQPGLDLTSEKLKTIASSGCNTWGLLLVVALVGHALVEVPRSLWQASDRSASLRRGYFQAAKISSDRCEAEENVDDILESLQSVSHSIPPTHPLHRNLEIVLEKIPPHLQERMQRCTNGPEGSTASQPPSRKALTRLHNQVIKSLQTLQRTENQWNILIDKVLLLEDVVRNQCSRETKFRSSFPVSRGPMARTLFTPTIEWYWRCVFEGYFLRLSAIFCATMSLVVLWSEITFFKQKPVLSLFAIMLDHARVGYHYTAIILISSCTIGYLCYCTHWTILRLRILNMYRLCPDHGTDECSLVFSGMMVCRLTPPLCLNYLGLIHMDSHVIATRNLETHYTQIMGHMDVISIVSDGFNIYFPMAMLAFCLATYWSLASRLLSALGFQQFLGDDRPTQDLVDEGKELVKREKRRRQRTEDSVNRRREFQDRFGTTMMSRYRTSRSKPEDRVRPLHRDDSTESARAVLLRDVEPVDYSLVTPTNIAASSRENLNDIHPLGRSSYDSRLGPPRGLFDDV